MPETKEPQRTWFERNGGLVLVGGVVAFIVMIVILRRLTG